MFSNTPFNLVSVRQNVEVEGDEAQALRPSSHHPSDDSLALSQGPHIMHLPAGVASAARSTRAERSPSMIQLERRKQDTGALAFYSRSLARVAAPEEGEQIGWGDRSLTHHPSPLGLLEGEGPQEARE